MSGRGREGGSNPSVGKTLGGGGVDHGGRERVRV